jgi:peptidoglycan/LPS O-acetylase OafA/YrhL
MKKLEIVSGKVPHLLRVAAVLSLVGLALMLWSLFDPRPGPVLIGLSLGQVLGTASFAIYLSIVVWDLRRRRREASTPEERASLSELR